MNVREMALFPLQTVLFPGGPLRLRIFETRYLDMIRRCMREEDVFGVVLIRTGDEAGTSEIYDTGTTAQICDWDTTSDGLLGITATGGESFRILETRRERDGLVVGSVRIDTASGRSSPLLAEHETAADILRRLLPLAGDAYARMKHDFDDANWVSCRLAELLPVEDPLKQAWLEMRDPAARLEHILSLVLPDEDEEA